MDFSVLLPDGWARIPLDGREDTRAAALAKAKASEIPAPQRHAAIQKIQRVIRTALSEARQVGGTDIFISLADRNGIPLIASCLVTYTEYDRPLPLQALAADLGKDGSEVSDAEIAGLTAVRHRFTDVPMERVDYHLRVPGRTGLLTLAFSTPSSPLAGPLVNLFDAIAETLRWQQ